MTPSVPRADAVRISAGAFDKLAATSTATLTSQLLKRGVTNTFMQGLIALRPDKRMVGYAFTLRYVPAREDVIDREYDNSANVQRLAVEAMQRDDVLVIDARGEVSSAASFGHILGTRIRHRGAAGLVTDGALRDTPQFRELDLPSYCKAAHAATSYLLHHPVEMNVPIGCGRVLVLPGDILAGDAEGVVVIPAKMAEEVAVAAYEQELREKFLLSKIEQGSSIVGVYPPNEKTVSDYADWRKRQK
jgi:regulator of RNase E activity RraA